MATIIIEQIRLRRDPEVKWVKNNPILANGEVGLVTDKFYIKFGDGRTKFNDLPAVAGEPGEPGIDGREIELRLTSTHFEWRYIGEPTWKQLSPISEITGPKGEDGAQVQLRINSNQLQWKYSDQSNWSSLINLDDLKGEDGTDGREVDFRVTQTHLQWRYIGDTNWQNLYELNDLKGPKGDTGPKGEQGEKGEKGDKGESGDFASLAGDPYDNSSLSDALNGKLDSNPDLYDSVEATLESKVVVFEDGAKTLELGDLLDLHEVSGENYYVVEAGDDHFKNGKRLLEAYDQAKTESGNLNETNRIKIIAYPGKYTFEEGVYLDMDTDFIDLYSVTGKPDVILSVDTDYEYPTLEELQDIENFPLIYGNPYSINVRSECHVRGIYTEMRFNLENDLPNTIVEDCVGNGWHSFSGRDPNESDFDMEGGNHNMASTLIRCESEGFMSFFPSRLLTTDVIGIKETMSGIIEDCNITGTNFITELGNPHIANNVRISGRITSTKFPMGSLNYCHFTETSKVENIDSEVVGFSLGCYEGLFINCVGYTTNPWYQPNDDYPILGKFINCRLDKSVTHIRFGLDSPSNATQSSYRLINNLGETGQIINCIEPDGSVVNSTDYFLERIIEVNETVNKVSGGTDYIRVFATGTPLQNGQEFLDAVNQGNQNERTVICAVGEYDFEEEQLQLISSRYANLTITSETGEPNVRFLKSVIIRDHVNLTGIVAPRIVVNGIGQNVFTNCISLEGQSFGVTCVKGELETTFNDKFSRVGSQLNGKFLKLTDGSIVVTDSNGRNPVKINQNGEYDDIFANNSAYLIFYSGGIETMVDMGDYFIIGGRIRYYQNTDITYRSGLLCLNYDGTVREDVQNNIGIGLDAHNISIRKIEKLNDGDLLLMGSNRITSWNGNSDVRGIIKLNGQDLTVNETFHNTSQIGASQYTNFKVLSSGDLILMRNTQNSIDNSLVYTNSDGIINNAFLNNLNGEFDSKRSNTDDGIHELDNGKIIILNGSVGPNYEGNLKGIAVINSDGSIDWDTTSALEKYVPDPDIVSTLRTGTFGDGKVWFHYHITPIPGIRDGYNKFIILNSDGSLNETLQKDFSNNARFNNAFVFVEILELVEGEYLFYTDTFYKHIYKELEDYQIKINVECYNCESPEYSFGGYSKDCTSTRNSFLGHTPWVTNQKGRKTINCTLENGIFQDPQKGGVILNSIEKDDVLVTKYSPIDG